MPSSSSTPAKKTAPSPAQQAMQKLGLVRDIDLVLHLPLRYEDETRITLLRNARDGDTVQIEATVTHCEVQLRPRRMLKVTVDDGTGTCVLTFFSFYPSQQKSMAVGTTLRIRGEVKGGFWGRSPPAVLTTGCIICLPQKPPLTSPRMRSVVPTAMLFCCEG